MRLRQRHEAALLRWGDLLISQRAEPGDWDFKSAVELRKNAADDRDAFNEDMEEHKLSCPACKT
jgi:hypothetical protein